MGILNATPDSFFDQGAYFSLEQAVARGMAMEKEGADLIDIGGASSRPGAHMVSEEEEMRRVLPLIEALQPSLSIPISIDSCTPSVVARALEKGVSLINDITGFQHPAMRELAAGTTADLCVMHMQGTPQTMHISPVYEEGVVEHLLRFFERQISLLVKAGISESRIILDPGIGFGKKFEHNLAILNELERFRCFGLRILIGASRKGFLKQFTRNADLLAPTLSAHLLAFLNGADILRAHDVKEHRAALDTIYKIRYSHAVVSG